jgi:ATP-dependent RNA helicase RhlE
MTENTQNGHDRPVSNTTDFAGLGLHDALLRAVRELGFEQPTPIQRDAIPAGLAGRDVLACAATGSGKTAAFLLPILQRLAPLPRGRTRALIITPTRELAAQIEEHRTGLSRHTKVTGAAVYGGVGMRPQEQALRRGADIIVATPGRLLDHMQYDYVDFSALEVLVLDEADRMLDMGFLPDIRRILARLPSARRQTLFFSATMPPPIAVLTREMLRNPATLNMERRQAPARGVAQALYPVSQELKPALLLELLKRSEIHDDVIVFCRTKHRANRLAQKLEKGGIRVARIHGNRSQAQRTEALAGFKQGRYQVLVATDIVARGIDITELGHVVNFDVPHVPEDYIHRIGRTGRAEATGDAFTFVAPDEEPLVRDIERAIGRRVERRVVPDFDYNARRDEPLEVPLQQRIAEIRARKAGDRARAAAKADARSRAVAQPQGRPERESRSEGSGTGDRRRRRGGRGRGPGRRGGAGSPQRSA